MATVKPIRIPFATPLQTRELQANLGTYTTDSFLVNCYVEKQEDGRLLVVKRPGSLIAYQYNAGGATTGQGTHFYKGCVFAIGSNVLYRLTGTGNGSTDGTAWAASTAATWAGRSNFGCCVFNNQIIIAGGQNAGGLAYLNDVWASSDGVNWTQLVSAAPWAKRIYGNLVVLGNTLYLVGGSGPTQDYNDVWSSSDGVNWTQVVGSAPWVARNGHVVVSYNQGIWVLGGYNTAAATYLNDVWFSPDGATWTQMVAAAGWSVRAFHSGIVQNNTLVIAGGFDGARNIQIWTSTDGIVWTHSTDLPAARSHMATFAYGNKVWWVGGYDAAAAKTTTVWSWPVQAVAPTVVSANYGGGAIQGAGAVVFRTQTSVNAFNSITMWLLGGNDAGFRNSIYTSTLNVALAASFSIPASSGSLQYQLTQQGFGDYLVFKNTASAWVLYGGIVTEILSPNYPPITVPGLVNLDDTVYVMDPSGLIWGSDLSNPFKWSSFNYIAADYQADTPIMLVKYQNYILVLKSSSSQIFYDAGRYPGSPLLPDISANSRVGCASAASVVNFNDTVTWIARTEELGFYAVTMDGMTRKKISNPQVDRLLGSWLPQAGDYASGLRINGHNFYLVTLSVRNMTLVYDFSMDQWWIALSGTAAAWGIMNYVTDGNYDYMQDPALGIIYRMTPQLFQDAGTTITSTGQLAKWDGGTNVRKFCSSLTVIADRLSPNAPVSPNQLSVSWSDDDAVTFNTPIVVDLTLARPKIPRVGSFRRRNFKWTHNSNNPMRLEAIELNVIGG